MIKFAGLTLFFSGIAALIYQISWIRLLGINVSSTATTTTLVLTALFGGLALGGLIAQWRLRRGQNGLSGFVTAQIIVAISAVLLLPVLTSADQLIILLPNQQVDSLYGFMGLFIILLIPATAQGMSLPFFTTWLAEVKQSNLVISHLYAFITLGGVAGILLTGFYLIPSFGLEGTLYSAAAFNLLSAGFALSLKSKKSQQVAQQPSLQQSNTPFQSVALLAAIAAVGFTLIGSEILWTKYLTIYTGTTLISYSTIAAIVLFGLAAGAMVIQYWQTQSALSFKLLFWFLIALFITLNVTHTLLSELPFLYGEKEYLGELLSTPYIFLLALILLLPTLLMGAVLALAFTLYSQKTTGVRQRFGFSYAIYTAFTMLAAALTILVITPKLGSSNALILFAYIPLITALLLVSQLHKVKRNLPAYAAIVALGSLAFFTPSIQYNEVLDQHTYRYIGQKTPSDFFYLNEKPTGLISFSEYDKELVFLQKNGLTKGRIHRLAAYKGLISESLPGVLAYLLQPNPINALVIGFDTGTTTRVLSNSDLDIVMVIDNNPGMVDAVGILGERNFKFLDDGRAELEYNEPRISLSSDTEKYSIITSRPLSPWLAGASHFYSQNFFELVKSRLTEEGIFAHTFSLFRVDTDLLKSILQTFYSAFPQGAVFSDLGSGELILLGSRQPLVLDYQRTKDYLELEEVTKTLNYGGFRNLEELPGYFLFSSRQALIAADNAQIITDNNLLLEVSIPPLTEQLPSGSNDPYQLFKQYAQKGFNRF